MKPRKLDPARLARAIHLDVRPEAGGWVVSGGAMAHKVVSIGGELCCDCIDAGVRHHTKCKHTLAVALSQGDPAALRGLREMIQPQGRA